METPKQASGQHEHDAAHALFAAIAQIGLAMRESRDPVTELGTLLAQLAETLGALRSAPIAEASENSVPMLTMRGLLEQLQSEVFRSIQHLQFYDRLTQHLSHLQEYLICVANELSCAKGGSEARAVWDEMHARLRVRLISDAQRGLLDLFLTPNTPMRVAAGATRGEHSAPGSMELF